MTSHPPQRETGEQFHFLDPAPSREADNPGLFIVQCPKCRDTQTCVPPRPDLRAVTSCERCRWMTVWPSKDVSEAFATERAWFQTAVKHVKQLQQESAQLRKDLEAMTKDRDLWRGEHEGEGCIEALATANARIAELENSYCTKDGHEAWLNAANARAERTKEALTLATGNLDDQWQTWIHEEGCPGAWDNSDNACECDGPFIVEKVHDALSDSSAESTRTLQPAAVLELDLRQLLRHAKEDMATIRAQTIEECARVADQFAEKRGLHDPGQVRYAAVMAERIRALATPLPTVSFPILPVDLEAEKRIDELMAKQPKKSRSMTKKEGQSYARIVDGMFAPTPEPKCARCGHSKEAHKPACTAPHASPLIDECLCVEFCAPPSQATEEKKDG